MSKSYEPKLFPQDQIDIKTWDTAKKIVQGWGEVAKEGWMKSCGFTYCDALILINADTHHMMLLHLDQGSESSIDINHMGKDVRNERYLPFQEQPGRKIALPVKGSISFPRDDIYRELNDDGFEVMSPIVVDSGENYWNLLVSADNGEVVIDNNNKRQIQVYYPFDKKLFANTPVRNQNDEMKNNLARNDIVQNAKEIIDTKLSEALKKLNVKATKNIFEKIKNVHTEKKIQRALVSNLSDGKIFDSFGTPDMKQNADKLALETIDIAKEFAVTAESTYCVVLAYCELAEKIETTKGLPVDTAAESLKRAYMTCEKAKENGDADIYEGLQEQVIKQRNRFNQKYGFAA